MKANKSQEILGIFLTVLGVLFLLVNNHLLWFGWEALWPTILFLIGLFWLRVFANRRKPRQLFLGTLLVQFGVFFFLFSSGILSWESMDVAWPTIPLIIGVSLLVLSGVVDPASSPLVIGIFFVLFAVFGYLAESGAIASRVGEPVVRLWPLVLVGAGILVFLRARRERLEQAGDLGTAPEPSHDKPE